MLHKLCSITDWTPVMVNIHVLEVTPASTVCLCSIQLQNVDIITLKGETTCYIMSLGDIHY